MTFYLLVDFDFFLFFLKIDPVAFLRIIAQSILYSVSHLPLHNDGFSIYCSSFLPNLSFVKLLLSFFHPLYSFICILFSPAFFLSLCFLLFKSLSLSLSLSLDHISFSLPLSFCLYFSFCLSLSVSLSLLISLLSSFLSSISLFVFLNPVFLHYTSHKNPRLL